MVVFVAYVPSSETLGSDFRHCDEDYNPIIGGGGEGYQQPPGNSQHNHILNLHLDIGGEIWLSRQGNTECERFLDKPVIALGVFIMLLSLTGLVGACCRVTWLLWIYLFVMFFLIVILFCFTVFAFVVTNKGAGEAISGKGDMEYRLEDYSNWLQKMVNRNWRRIRSCTHDSKVCKSLIDQRSGTPFQSFYNQHLSALQM
ncbi:PREDICTED: tetraspanin-8-like [Ipomoea nil]|uniref:tetraspanin-8-like n=1 Tax=Ipomoea nil TaxID=35883 RepID=UPI000900D379|nr:PREDICTED: tetraspanin-8-like [Ipomoea nil]